MYKRNDANSVWHCWNQMKVYSKYMYNLLTKSEGLVVFNQEGKSFIDGISTLVNCNVGHGNEYIINAITAQLKKMSVNSLFITSNEPSITLARKLCGLTNNHFEHVFYTNSGSEGIDTAIKIARQYYFNQKKRKFKTYRSSYNTAFPITTISSDL